MSVALVQSDGKMYFVMIYGFAGPGSRERGSLSVTDASSLVFTDDPSEATNLSAVDFNLNNERSDGFAALVYPGSTVCINHSAVSSNIENYRFMQGKGGAVTITTSDSTMVNDNLCVVVPQLVPVS